LCPLGLAAGLNFVILKEVYYCYQYRNLYKQVLIEIAPIVKQIVIDEVEKGALGMVELRDEP